MIPKILHLCWLSGDPYPAKIEKCIQSWKKNLPDYEIIIWDTKRFDIESNTWVKQAFEKKKYAFAADYIRFYALYHYGGIYLDSDVEVLKNFNDLLSYPYFMGTEKAGTIEAAIMGAEKGQDWVKACLDYYHGKKFIKKDGSIDIRKVPEIMGEAIQKIKPVHMLTPAEAKHMEKFDFHQEVIVLPDTYFSPKLFDSREVIITPETYAIHHYQNSWFSHKAYAYYRTRSILIRIFGYKLIRVLEKKIMHKKR